MGWKKVDELNAKVSCKILAGASMSNLGTGHLQLDPNMVPKDDDEQYRILYWKDGGWVLSESVGFWPWYYTAGIVAVVLIIALYVVISTCKEVSDEEKEEKSGDVESPP